MVENNLNLPEDLAMEILPRLPVKSLVRFKCVAKSWKTLFKTPSFVSKQLSASSAKNKNCPLLMISELEDPDNYTHYLNLVSNGDPVPNFYKPFDFKKVNGILGPCNGIFCLDYSLHDYERSWPLILWNPATREVKFPPPFLCPPSDEHSAPVYGFGIDPKTNDYKIVKLLMFSADFFEVYDKPVIAEVYSFNNDSWKIINDVVPSCYIQLVQHNSYANGVHCWISGQGSVEGKGDDPLMPGDRYFKPILCFDMSTDTFQEIMAPLKIDPINDRRLTDQYDFYDAIAVINDRISYVCQYANYLCTLIDIASMNEYNGAKTSWTISSFTLHYERPQTEKLYIAFCGCLKDGEIVLSGLPRQEFLISFKGDDDSELQPVREIRVRCRTCSEFWEYTESIASLTM